jgi:hypothetical protein
MLLALVATSCVTRPVYEVRQARLPAAREPGEHEVAEMIQEAGRRLGWKIERLAPGEMRGEYARGRHQAVVRIEYDSTTYSIVYADSAYLKYDGASIHEIYNDWIEELESAIGREASFRLR